MKFIHTNKPAKLGKGFKTIEEEATWHRNNSPFDAAPAGTVYVLQNKAADVLSFRPANGDSEKLAAKAEEAGISRGSMARMLLHNALR